MGELEVQGLTKRFGDHLVVDHVSFCVKEGELFALVGPSGSGKTTILRLICGLEQPDEGRVIINGQDVTELPPERRNLGVIFQHYVLYPHKDVYSNIAFALRLQKMEKAVIDMRVAWEAQVLRIGHLLQRKAMRLSAGEQQRVALARALVKNADAFLFDEPLSNLDPSLRLYALQEIVIAHRVTQCPGVYVTHEQRDALAIAHHLAVLDEGQIQQVGKWYDVLYSPSTVFVSQFLQNPPMNILPAILERVGERYRVRASVICPLLPNKWDDVLDAYKRKDVLLGIRPDAITLEWLLKDQDTLYYKMQTEVVDVDTLTGMAIIKLKLGEDDTLTTVLYGTDVYRVKVGHELVVGIQIEQICLFDPKTERSLSISHDFN